MDLDIPDSRRIAIVSDVFAKMKANEKLCDVVFIVEGRKFPAHRAYIAAWSEPFKAMFSNKEFSEGKQVEIELKDIRASIFALILKFIYSIETDFLDEENVIPLMKAADMYQIDILQDFCGDFLQEHVGINNCCAVLFTADQFNSMKLKKYCLSFISEFFEKVYLTDSWGHLHPDLLGEIMSNDELNIKDEISVFLALVKWLQYPSRFSVFMQELFERLETDLSAYLGASGATSVKFEEDVSSGSEDEGHVSQSEIKMKKEKEFSLKERLAYVDQLLPHIRFPLINGEYLMDIVQRNWLLKGNKTLLRLLLEAFQFKSYPKRSSYYAESRVRDRVPLHLDPSKMRILFGLDEGIIRDYGTAGLRGTVEHGVLDSGVENIRDMKHGEWNTGSHEESYVEIEFKRVHRIGRVSLRNRTNKQFQLFYRKMLGEPWLVLVPFEGNGVHDKIYRFDFLKEVVLARYLKIWINQGTNTSLFWASIEGW